MFGLRPQAPPAIALGRNTFDGGAIAEPLLDVRLPGTEIDLYAMVDDQFVRILTIAADLHLPVGIDVDAEGGLLPVIGEASDSVSNISVKNSEALEESPDSLAEILPSLIEVALPVLGSSLGSIDLPALGPLAIQLAPGGITTVEDNTFLALFGNLSAATPPRARPGSRPRRAWPRWWLRPGPVRGALRTAARARGPGWRGR